MRAHVAMINRTLAQRYFPNGDAIGHSLKLPKIDDPSPEMLSAANIADSWLPIVGIVDDFLNDGLRKPIQPAIFVPYTLSMLGVDSDSGEDRSATADVGACRWNASGRP